jgi:hypothetical protein
MAKQWSTKHSDTPKTYAVPTPLCCTMLYVYDINMKYNNITGLNTNW